MSHLPRAGGEGRDRKRDSSAERRIREGHSEGCQESVSVCLTINPSLSFLAILWDNRGPAK